MGGVNVMLAVSTTSCQEAVNIKLVKQLRNIYNTFFYVAIESLNANMYSHAYTYTTVANKVMFCFPQMVQESQRFKTSECVVLAPCHAENFRVPEL